MRYIKYAVLAIILLVGLTLAAWSLSSGNSTPDDSKEFNAEVVDCAEQLEQWKQDNPAPVEPVQPADVDKYTWQYGPSDYTQYIHDLGVWSGQSVAEYNNCLGVE